MSLVLGLLHYVLVWDVTAVVRCMCPYGQEKQCNNKSLDGRLTVGTIINSRISEMSRKYDSECHMGASVAIPPRRGRG